MPAMKPEVPPQRLSEYLAERSHEDGKTKTLKTTASKLQEEATGEMHKHHRFAYSVALLQVAIALGAVSALTRMKSVWLVSLCLGAAGIAYFVLGFLAR